ncbi:MAG: hypothetical protein NPIRA02_38070 [Nitrospirales bacterium]|nr:MAG: hypothetical protein NPIRA02_38070 [Nitrospirales bacterium]
MFTQRVSKLFGNGYITEECTNLGKLAWVSEAVNSNTEIYDGKENGRTMNPEGRKQSFDCELE